MRVRLIAPTFAAFVLVGCALPGSSPPSAATPEVPNTWRDGHGLSTAALTSTWWMLFGDEHLNALIDASLRANTDLMIASARVSEATALVRATSSTRFPALDGVLGAQHARDLDFRGQPFEAASGAVGVRISYEADFWGRLGSLDQAQRQTLMATQAAHDTLRLGIATTIAKLYVSLVSLDHQLAITRRTISTRVDGRDVVARRVLSGYASRLEQSQAEAELAAAQQREAVLLAAIGRTESALCALAGRPPGPVARATDLDRIALPAIPVSAPSQVVAARPDIAQAEHQLMAAEGSYAAARANLLPQVRLTAALDGVDSEALVDPVGLWSVGGSVLAPIFNGGRLEAQASASEARRDAAAYAYRGAVLNAFAEVETALANATYLRQQETAISAQRAALGEALVHATNRYQAGYVSYLEQIDAQRQSLAADLAAVQILEARFNAAIDLIRATGGGWRPPPRTTE